MAKETDGLRVEFSHPPGADDALANLSGEGSGEPLIAYLHLHRGASQATKALWEGHIRGFADREGYDLARLVVGVEGGTDEVARRVLEEQLHATGAKAVLVVGPARHVLVALHGMARHGVRTVNLAHVRPAADPRTDRRTDWQRRTGSW